MRKTIATAVAAAATACLLPASASAAETCDAKARWHYSVWGTHATVFVDRATATGNGCARLLPPDGTAYGTRLSVFSGSAPPLFAVAELVRDGAAVGALKVTGGDLDAVVRGEGTLAVHDGDGSRCGDGCYRTTGHWAAQ